jgi:hypothetical protein
MKFGLIVIAVSVVWYIAHVVVYNYFLQKNNPGIFEEEPKKRGGIEGQKEVTVVMTSGQTPAWVMLLGIPPLPLFLFGVVVTIIGTIFSLFR